MSAGNPGQRVLCFMLFFSFPDFSSSLSAGSGAEVLVFALLSAGLGGLTDPKEETALRTREGSFALCVQEYSGVSHKKGNVPFCRCHPG